jgi:hypothetical protein
VSVFFGGHAVKHSRRGGIIGAQAFGIGAVDAGVILFRGNRQREDFLLGQIGKPAAGGNGRQHERSPETTLVQ